MPVWGVVLWDYYEIFRIYGRVEFMALSWWSVLLKGCRRYGAFLHKFKRHLATMRLRGSKKVNKWKPPKQTKIRNCQNFLNYFRLSKLLRVVIDLCLSALTCLFFYLFSYIFIVFCLCYVVNKMFVFIKENTMKQNRPLRRAWSFTDVWKWFVFIVELKQTVRITVSVFWKVDCCRTFTNCLTTNDSFTIRQDGASGSSFAAGRGIPACLHDRQAEVSHKTGRRINPVDFRFGNAVQRAACLYSRRWKHPKAV